ncbi:MAG: histidinol-phosphatase HisJ family protein [Clostridiales bacterium]|nr:histidinol-phosphatase HisJ family protein [Clostridiales bacterium]
MILADCHTHTTFSFDARDNEHSDPENMIRTAIAKGLKYYSITDHEDGPRDDIDYHFDSDEYFKVLTALKNKYSNQIEVGVGIEIGLDPKYTDYSNRIVASKPFDIVVGSVHYVYGIDPYYPEYFRDRTFDEGYRRAFEYTLECLNSGADFDILGHIDYVARYGDRNNGDGFYSRFGDILDEILTKVIQEGKGIEVNTAGLKYKMPYPNPSKEIVKRYRELGGEIITVSSDAHRPEHIAYDFGGMSDFLTDCGFKYYTIFNNRKKTFINVC